MVAAIARGDRSRSRGCAAAAILALFVRPRVVVSRLGEDREAHANESTIFSCEVVAQDAASRAWRVRGDHARGGWRSPLHADNLASHPGQARAARSDRLWGIGELISGRRNTAHLVASGDPPSSATVQALSYGANACCGSSSDSFGAQDVRHRRHGARRRAWESAGRHRARRAEHTRRRDLPRPPDCDLGAAVSRKDNNCCHWDLRAAPQGKGSRWAWLISLLRKRRRRWGGFALTLPAGIRLVTPAAAGVHGRGGSPPSPESFYP